MPREKGPFEVLERINNNVYKLNLPEDLERMREWVRMLT